MTTAPRELTLILTDLYLDAEERDALVHPSLPRLPALELIAARSSELALGDWRDAVLGRLNAKSASIDQPSSHEASALQGSADARARLTSVAALSRLAMGDTVSAEAQGQWWIASAVHLQAGHDHVQVSAILDLQRAEWRALSDSFAAQFGTGEGTLAGGQGSYGYLSLREPLQARSHDPARVLGRDVHDYLPQGLPHAADPGGGGAARLRRLMTELQMWLHEHPVNRERAAQGLLPVTGLWLWGGEPSTIARPGAPLPILLSADHFLRGLWRSCGEESDLADLPAYDALLARTDDSGEDARMRSQSLLIAVPLRDFAESTLEQRLQQFDRQWLVPAVSALRRGRFGYLRLCLNDRTLGLARGDLWRFWRTRRPWPEVIA